MKIGVIGDKALRSELTAQGLVAGTELIELEDPGPEINGIPCIDLQFTPDPKRIEQLTALQAPVVLVNAVETTLKELPEGWVRINGWPTLLRRTIVEAAAAGPKERAAAEQLIHCFGKKTEWVPDQPGFIAPRVVSMIINEAFLALEEGVSDRKAIDTAMKLGTNYPYGPFEWVQAIGPLRIVTLLETLSGIHPRYTPAPLLRKELTSV
ncbi:MAG: hypothetical protein RJA57_1162 [Bacteroidota bacterium]